MTIRTAAGRTVSAPLFGILAENDSSIGRHDLTIIADSEVVNARHGIAAEQRDDGDLLIQTSDTVEGWFAGIEAENAAGGDIVITSTGPVETLIQYGISAINQDNLTRNISIDAVDVTGGVAGILAENNGTGSTIITARGTVSANETGIVASNTSTATGAMEINVLGDVSSLQDGIVASNRGSGDLTVTVSGTVTGENGDAIYTLTGLGGTTTITLDAGARVSAAAGRAIVNYEGESTTTVNTGASIVGGIELGSGSDTLNIFGVDVSGVTQFDGGDDIDSTDGFVDVLTFTGSSGTISTASVAGWEQIAIGAGSTLSVRDTTWVAGSTTVDGGSVLDASGGGLFLQGDGGSGGNLTNLSTITLQDGAAGDALVVAGDYTGGGTLRLDVDFGRGTADTLVVQGALSGVTTIEIANVSAAASGTDILLVDTDGITSPTDAFTFVGGPQTNGAFLYEFEQNASDLDWYLRSTLTSTGAVYQSSPEVLGGFNNLPTLGGRLSQRSSAGDQERSTAEGRELWVRVVGDRLESTLSSASGRTSFESTQTGVQAGADFDLETNGIGRWVVGATVQYGQISANISSAGGTGQIDADGYGIGATGTWFSGSGMYLDFQGQMNWISSDMSSSTSGNLITGHKSQALALSAEVGQQFTLPGGGTLIPQAQLIWGMLNGEAFTDEDGNAVDPGTNDTLVTRLGLAYETEVTDRGQFNAIGNIWHDLSGAQTTNVAGADLSAEAESTWAEIGIGGDLQLAPGQSLYGEASYRTALGGASSDNQGLRLSAGFRMDF
ncbi:autotransporter outer membrane beta-barrel domain-containing protein [Fontisubflavum oceani]|uniref:autotransporter family protein n=1 Tax=Fontisubflavum oceani TaxID=2978973 RepID=UPI0025B55BD5|nr:autotransporter outer membrane beta-barrel domain-containing protein [Fontisubflavum oceani]WJY20824.1 autotransporter outer membrane beta-barrel domain-containing protein [Fontisubflavum oceani]